MCKVKKDKSTKRKKNPVMVEDYVSQGSSEKQN